MLKARSAGHSVRSRKAVARKSDRLPATSEATAARQVIRVSTVSRAGNRDVMRVRPFVRIAGNLSLTTSDLSSKIPPFSAQRVLTDVDTSVTASTDDTPGNAEPDAEVSFVTRDLASVLPRAKIVANISIDEILLRVRDTSAWRGNAGVKYASNAG